MLCDNCQKDFPQHAAAAVPPPCISTTDLQKLLRSPYPPSATQVSQIPGIITNIDTEIHYYETRILRLQSEMTLLENKQTQLKIQRQRYNSLLAPIRRLPTEVLNHVFVMYANVKQTCLNVIQYRAISLTGQKLVSICGRWREVASSCSALWTGISLGLSIFIDLNEAKRITAALQWCLDHAGPTAPLDITLIGFIDDDTGESEYCKLLTAQASRWRELCLFTEGDFVALFPSITEAENPIFPSLEIFRPCELEDLALFGNAPNLRELSLFFEVDTNDDMPAFPLHQIKTLKLECNSHNRVPIAPSMFPELESLSYLFSSMLSAVPDIPSHTSKSLQFLSIILQTSMDNVLLPKTVEKVLESACYPSLKRMVVDFSPHSPYNAHAIAGRAAEDMAWPQREVTSFILRSGCSLTFLQLKDVFISTHDLLSLLLHTPALSHLDIFQTHRRKPTKGQLNNMASTRNLQPLTMEWIKRLHAHGTENSYDFGNALVPKLTHLSLTVLSDWFDNDQLFINVILSRWVPDTILAEEIGIACLKSVELKVWGRLLDEKVYQPLIRLGKAGMKVEVLGKIPPSQS